RDIVYLFRKSKRPSGWRLCTRSEEGGRDRFRFHERMRDNSAVKVARPLNTERSCLIHQQRIVGDEIHGAGVVFGDVVLSSKIILLDRRKRSGVGGQQGILVRAQRQP